MPAGLALPFAAYSSFERRTVYACEDSGPRQEPLRITLKQHGPELKEPYGIGSSVVGLAAAKPPPCPDLPT